MIISENLGAPLEILLIFGRLSKQTTPVETRQPDLLATSAYINGWIDLFISMVKKNKNFFYFWISVYLVYTDRVTDCMVGGLNLWKH